MALIDLRVYTQGTAGAWTKSGKAKAVSTNPAQWAIMSPLIVRRPLGPPSLVSVLTETCLLLDHLIIQPGEPLRWTPWSRRSPSHLSRFMSESLGLALAGDLAQQYGWLPGPALMLDADALPEKFKPLLTPSGFPRPDYFYWTPKGLRGGEARARRTASPKMSKRPAGAQKEKLTKLDAWAAEVHKALGAAPAWSMSWAWATSSETVVDLFDPGDPIDLDLADAFNRHHRRIGDYLTRPTPYRRQGGAVAMASRQLFPTSADEDGRWLTLCAWRGEAEDVVGLSPLERRAEQLDRPSRAGVLWSAMSPFMWAGITTAERGPTRSPGEIFEIEQGS